MRKQNTRAKTGTANEMEDNKMSTEMNKINDEALDNVVGGVKRVVDTGTSQNAAVRDGAGKGYEQIASLKNGTIVNATGKFKKADGRNWAEIDSPVDGWIAASIIGYER